MEVMLSGMEKYPVKTSLRKQTFFPYSFLRELVGAKERLYCQSKNVNAEH